jgi:hypothetical protein
MKKETFNAVSSLNLQTSYGIVRKEKDVPVGTRYMTSKQAVKGGTLQAN